MGTDIPSPIFFTKWIKRPRFFGDVSSICHLHRQHYDARIVHQSVRACIHYNANFPPRAGAAAAQPEIIVEPTSFVSLVLGMFCHKINGDRSSRGMDRPRDGSSGGRVIQGTDCPGDGTSRGRILQGKVWIIQGTDRPRDGSSKGRIVQGTFHPGDGSLQKPRVRIVTGMDHSGAHRQGTERLSVLLYSIFILSINSLADFDFTCQFAHRQSLLSSII
jgi:hypothetical protein